MQYYSKKWQITGLFIGFLCFSFLVIAVVTSTLLYPKVTQLVEDQQAQYIENQLSLVSRLLENELDSFRSALTDFSSIPLLSNSVMETGLANDGQITDFLKTLSIRNKKLPLKLINISGEVINGYDGELYEPPWLNALMAGQQAFWLHTKQQKEELLIECAVPVYYRGYAEGVLWGAFTIDLSQKFSEVYKAGHRIQLFRPHVDTTAMSEVYEQSLSGPVPGYPSIHVSFVYDRRPMMAREREALLSMLRVGVIAFIIIIIVMGLVGYRMLLIPFRAADESRHKSKELNERMSLATSIAHIGVWDYVLKEDCLIWDERMHQIYESNPIYDTPTYSLWAEALHPADRSEAESALKRAIDRHENYDTEFRILTASGHTKYIRTLAKPYYDKLGNPVRIVGINQDVTVLRKAQEELIVMREAIENFTYGVVISDANDNNRLVYVNPAFETLTGYTKEEALNRNCRFLQSGQRNQEALNHLRAAINRQQSVDVVLDNYRKDGTHFKNHLTISPVFIKGHLTHYIGLQHDITDELLRKDQLIEAKQKAEEFAHKAELANKAKSAFLASMSHEIRTPMNAVLGMADLLMNTSLDDEQRDCLGTLRKAGELLLNLINDILDFSKVESGRLEVECIPFDLGQCIKDAMDLLHEKCDSIGLELVYTELTQLESGYLGDRGRLQQIILNLLSNAVKFTKQGSIHVRVKSERTGVLSKVVVEVEDTGIGMDAEALKRLFKPFTQADSSITRKYGGTGLGLSISKRLAKLMNGDLTCQSVVGEGSTFILEINLPICESEEEAVPSGSVSKTSSHVIDKSLAARFPLAILVVEDNPVNRKVMTKMLTKMGFTPDLSEDGFTAIDAVGGHSYDLILMDLEMPGMSGIETTEKLMELFGADKLPDIVALTANVMAEHRKACQEVGMSGYLCKPIQIGPLTELIQKVYEKKSLGLDR